jgi:hypothetical protein
MFLPGSKKGVFRHASLFKCSIDHSDISPFRINELQGRAKLTVVSAPAVGTEIALIVPGRTIFCPADQSPAYRKPLVKI